MERRLARVESVRSSFGPSVFEYVFICVFVCVGGTGMGGEGVEQRWDSVT